MMMSSTFALSPKKRERGKCSSSFCRRLSYMYTHLSKNIFLKCYFFFWLASGGPVWLLLEGEKSIGDVGNDTPRGEDNPSAGKKGTKRKRYYTKWSTYHSWWWRTLSVKQLWHEPSEPHLFLMMDKPSHAGGGSFSKNSYWLKEDDLNNNKIKTNFFFFFFFEFPAIFFFFFFK